MRDADIDTAAQSAAAATCADAAIAAFGAKPSPLPLDCGVQHYDWGDTDFIPALLGEPNPTRRPCAELWIGAHPDLPSVARIGDTPVPLHRLIETLPETLLGGASIARFGPRLPFLFKVLAARQPLSIQAHPDAPQARAGFERENRAGLALSDPRRSYRDPNHKPELVVALTDFHALCGFRPLAEIETELAGWPSLATLAGGLAVGGTDRLETLYRHLMSAPQTDVNRLLDPIIADLTRRRGDRPFDPDSRHDWLLAADRDFSRPGARDRGLFSLLLLNLVHLRPGQALYLPAGQLHCYLRGAAVEVMANSNNVLRGGLTHKHIDVPELLHILRLDPGRAELVTPTAPDHPERPHAYRVPAAEFALEQHQIGAGERRGLDGGRLRLGLVLKGRVELGCAHRPGLVVRRSHAFLVPAACGAELRGIDPAVVYTVRAP
jgi:mannose-6-phosphate isomerase class I